MLQKLMSFRGEPLKLGICGLGTVGAALIPLLQNRPEFEITAISARDKKRDRGVDLSKYKWVDDPVSLARNPNVDVVVELIGGADGAAKSVVETALQTGKHVVTANKALLAAHGVKLAALAQEANMNLCFEGAVAGGIPAIKTLRESLAGNQISRVYGILNGTCNYILTRMKAEGLSFDECLKAAQQLGYAEADPTFDIGGFDTAHKLTLLASLAFGVTPQPKDLYVEGIEALSLDDIKAADELGYNIKLLGIAEQKNGEIMQRIHPAMVEKTAPLAGVSGVTNAVAIDGDAVGSLLLVGPGAGGKATASAVMSDLIDLAYRRRTQPFVKEVSELKNQKPQPISMHKGQFYLSLYVLDKPGSIAAIATHLADENISIQSLVQHGQSADSTQRVVIITYPANEGALRRALAKIESEKVVDRKVQTIRIEPLS